MTNTFCRVNTFFSNDISPYIPQLWAMESLMILQENMVAAGLVHTDFSNQVHAFGETVNTRRPGSFTAIRKDVNDSVTDQDASATNVPVVLNQHAHVSFYIRDVQQSKSFKDLVAEFAKPAAIAMAKFVDQCILGQYAQFIGNQYGQIDGLSGSTVKDYLLGTRQVMNANLAPEANRNMILTSASETSCLSSDLFLRANESADGGNALRNAELGRKLGFNTYMSQNASNVASTAVNLVAGTGVVNLSAGYARGTTTILISGLTAALPANGFIKIDGRVYRIVSSVGGATPSSVTISSGLTAAVANGASVVAYSAGAVNLSAGYAAGYVGSIACDGMTNRPVVGQMVSFGTSTTAAVYTIVAATSTTITLDRPLEAALVDDQTLNVGPPGQFNFAFLREAIALVMRPLWTPPAGVGANCAVANYNNTSMRATITYDGSGQGIRVTLDTLFGVKVLDSRLGAVMLG